MDENQQREKSRLRRRKIRFLLVIAVILSFHCVAVCPTAMQVKQAMKDRDACYLPDYYLEKPEWIPEFDYSVDIRFLPMEEYISSIPARFNCTEQLPNRDDFVRVRVVPLIALYGIGTKSVWLSITQQYYDQTGEYAGGSYRIPVRIDYRWNKLYWKTEDINYYDFGIIDWYSETPLRDFWKEDLMLR